MDPRTPEQTRKFDEVVVPHIAEAYNLARWITRSATDAEDVVQESCLRAFKYIDTFKGGSSRAWLFTIVRNVSYSWLERNRPLTLSQPLDEEAEGLSSTESETLLQQAIDVVLLKIAVDKLPLQFREVIVLRDMEGLSYKEIAQIEEIPVGTVMSRIARARRKLIQLISTPNPS